MTIIELTTVLANLALALTFIIGLFFGVAQVKAVERDRRERLTLETLRNFQAREFAELLQFVTRTDFPKNREELNGLPANQQVMLIQFGQQMESLGILVAENLIDIALVDKTLGSFIVSSWDKYKGMFSAMRERDPFLGEYFQWLAERMGERMKNSPRKPFYIESKG